MTMLNYFSNAPLALECGYWQVSQLENWVSSVCIMPPEDDFSGGYHHEAGRARRNDFAELICCLQSPSSNCYKF
jgi:hypothetical protein